MLITVQLPCADVRHFVAGPTGQLKRPRWLNPRYDKDFVRHIGPVRGRLLQAVSPWPAEGTICDAHKLFRLAADLSVLGDPARAGTRSFRVAYRRLMSNGETVVRVELGIANSRPGQPYPRPIGKYGIDGILSNLASLPVRVPLAAPVFYHDNQNAPAVQIRDVALHAAGKSLAEALLQATTATSGLETIQPWWITAGRPMAVVQYRRTEVAANPFFAREVTVSGCPGVRLLYDQRQWGHCWFVSSTSATWNREARQLRVHLLRLHAEFEALSAVLDAVADGRLAEPGTREAGRLSSYLEHAAGFLQRRTVYGHEQPPLLRLAYGYQDEYWAGRREDLQEFLRQLKPSTLPIVSRALDDLRAPDDTMPVI